MFATGPRAVGFTIVWPEGVIFRSMMTYHMQFLLLVLAGWVNRQQQDVIDYEFSLHCPTTRAAKGPRQTCKTRKTSFTETGWLQPAPSANLRPLIKAAGLRLAGQHSKLGRRLPAEVRW